MTTPESSTGAAEFFLTTSGMYLYDKSVASITFTPEFFLTSDIGGIWKSSLLPLKRFIFPCSQEKCFFKYEFLIIFGENGAYLICFWKK